MKKAVIIKGNPKFVTNNQEADRFYAEIKDFLEQSGYAVRYDDGEPYTIPPDAELWIGHSRGSDRLRFAPGGVQTIAFGAKDGINHREDKSLSLGDVPGPYHYIFTDEMKAAIVTATTGLFGHENVR